MNYLGVVALILLCETSLSNPSNPSSPSPSSSTQNDIATRQTPDSSTKSTSLNRIFNRTSNATIPYSAPLESKLTEEASLSTTTHTGTTLSSWHHPTSTSGVPTTDTPKIVHRCRNDELKCPGKKCIATIQSTTTEMGNYNSPIKCECTGSGDREGWYRPNRQLIATNTHNKTILEVNCNSRYIPRISLKTGCTWFSAYSPSDGVTMVSYRVGDPDKCEPSYRTETSPTPYTTRTTATQPLQRSFGWKSFTKDPWVKQGANHQEMCRPGSHYCSSGQCWIRTEVSSGQYAHKDGYGIVNCSCIIPGEGKDNDDMRWHISDNDKRIRYPMVRFIQCKGQHSSDINIGVNTRVTCGWVTENRFTEYFRSNGITDKWNYEKLSKDLKTVGTPYDCALASKKFGEMLIAIIIFVILFLAIIVFIWALRRNGHCGTDVATDAPLPSVSQVPPPRPTDPTLLRTPSIPTYSECLEGSHRIVSDSNYVSLPTTEEQGPPSYGDDLLEKLPPAYEDIEGHEDLYNVAGNADHMIQSRV